MGKGVLCSLLERLNLYLIRLNLGMSSLHLHQRLLMQLDVQRHCMQQRIMGSPSLGLAISGRRKEQTTLWSRPMRTVLTHTRTHIS